MKAIFLHIQKTAGTSIVNTARNCFGNEQVASHGDVWTIERNTIRSKNFISSHLGFAYAKPLLTERYAFTFLRDPVDRIISLYNFLHNWTSDDPTALAAKSANITIFLERCLAPPQASDMKSLWLYENVWNNQAWQIAHGWGDDVHTPGRMSVLDFSTSEILNLAKANIDKLDYVGFVHSYDEDVSNIFRNMGFKKHIGPIRANVTNKGLSRQDVPNEALQIIQEATRLDQLLYDHALQRNEQLKSRNPAMQLAGAWKQFKRARQLSRYSAHASLEH